MILFRLLPKESAFGSLAAAVDREKLDFCFFFSPLIVFLSKKKKLVSIPTLISFSERLLTFFFLSLSLSLSLSLKTLR